MSADDAYPETPAGPFPTPPRAFTDGDGRAVRVAACDDAGPIDRLVEMYEAFDAADRAQGLPPVGEPRVREWIRTLFAEGLNVVAEHDGRLVGHATLVPDDGEGYELAIFVLQAYQGAGIGTQLLSHLLGHGAAAGVECAWLTVERWNRPAIGLYEKVGFERVDDANFEMEMVIRLH